MNFSKKARAFFLAIVASLTMGIGIAGTIGSNTAEAYGECYSWRNGRTAGSNCITRGIKHRVRVYSDNIFTGSTRVDYGPCVLSTNRSEVTVPWTHSIYLTLADRC